MMTGMNLAVDHLLYVGPTLDPLVNHARLMTGILPTPGGRHVGKGTHNALTGLGEDAYLELLALDDTQPEGGDFADAITGVGTASLHAWCVRTDDGDALAARLDAMRCSPVRESMSRVTPEGDTLAWELLFPQGHTFAGAAPFFIAWGDTPHPASTLPAAATLDHLTVWQRDPDPLRAWLRDVGLDDARVEVLKAPARGLRAALHGRRGAFTLRGAAGGMDLAARGQTP